ncbi:MAG: reverse transcriptase-like protein [Lachnospiraceae bacterium]|nr:reverse transcriptase-like protein [Lachnospiraceae bacterium]
MKKKYYAVFQGKTPGVYLTWDDCKAQVHGVTGACFKSFATPEEALYFAQHGKSLNTDATKTAMSDATQSIEAATCAVDTEAIAYVDGSYNAETCEFSYGMVFLWNGQELHFSEKPENQELRDMRNVAGEICGSMAAMHYAIENGISSITIYHDYEGIAKWCTGVWEAKKPGTIEYRKYYEAIKEELEVKFIKVKGHSGDKYNDMADELAKKAVFST